MTWQEAHNIIVKNSKYDEQNKRADMELTFWWKEFKNIKGKTFGETIRRVEKKLGVHPSFLACCCDTIKEYIERKYL